MICPAAQQMFKKFRDVSIDQLSENKEFRSHGLYVAEAMSLVILALDDAESFVLVLKDLGAVHSSYGLQDIHFIVS